MKLYSRFYTDDRGAIAMTFGLILLVIAGFAGIAVDLSRAYNVSSFMSAALDSTTLATARELQLRDMSDAEVQQYAQTRYTSLLGNRVGTSTTFGPLTIAVNRTDEILKISAASVVPTHFAGLVSRDHFDVSESTMVNYRVKIVELALVLDVTGSMSGSKIASLKSAASELIEQMIPQNPRNRSNRVALAPYAAAVNAGSLSDLLTEPGIKSVDSCVVGRENSTDERPGNLIWLGAFEPDNPFVDQDPVSGANRYSCPTAEVLPLSKDRSELLNRVQDLTTGGFTAGHIGAAWGWYLVSPKWKSIFDSSSAPAEHSDEDTIKAVLLMTDGNFNIRFNGVSGDTSDAQARVLCENMKQSGVTVYSVAFEAPAAAEATLRACASSNTHYFSADNGTELSNAFEEIGKNLTSLRLTN